MASGAQPNRHDGKLCTADQFAELCAVFRRTCLAAEVIAGPEEARQFARMKGEAFRWFCLQLGNTPEQTEWMAFIRKQAIIIRELINFDLEEL